MPGVVASRAQTFVGAVMHLISVYPLLSAYYRSIYHNKRMHLLTRVYGIANVSKYKVCIFEPICRKYQALAPVTLR